MSAKNGSRKKNAKLVKPELCKVSEAINIDLIFGYTKLVQTSEIVGSKIRMGGYSIRYDRAGNEVGRTENTWNGELECHSKAEAMRLCRTADGDAQP